MPKRRVPVRCVIALATVLVSLPCLSPTLLAAKPSRPNFIVIVCDDMGFSDLGCYGGEIDTPNLDRLASSGLRFVDFHNNAKCSETRASLMTGLWHQQSKNLKKPGNATIAEVLKPAGYRTLMSGKWHLAGEPPERGFDRYFGFLGGCINFFTGNDWGSGENLMRLDRNVFDVPDDFYSTDAITDYAIDFLNEGESDDRPFFLYLAHNAPHFPLHAPEEDIAKYRGRYRVGWDEIRRRRYQRLQELGIADETWNLSDRDSKVESWDSLTAKEREFLEPMMEVYAAMVDRLDQNIGRLIDHLESTGQLNNTLIFFFSDNGACPYQRLKGDMLVPGSGDSDIAYDARWANMCNTPLRNYKQYAHHGGTLTPMIAHWPNGIQDTGGLNHFPSHLVDIMPTLVELAGATYPTQRNGQDVFPMEGVSLAATLQGKETSRQRKPIYWEFANNHAVRDGNWKLVAERTKDWELYDISRDRCETNNIIEQYPDVAKRLAKSYDQWAKRVGAKTHAKCLNSSPSNQSQLFNLDKLLRDPQ